MNELNAKICIFIFLCGMNFFFMKKRIRYYDQYDQQIIKYPNIANNLCIFFTKTHKYDT